MTTFGTGVFLVRTFLVVTLAGADFFLRGYNCFRVDDEFSPRLYYLSFSAGGGIFRGLIFWGVTFGTGIYGWVIFIVVFLI